MLTLLDNKTYLFEALYNTFSYEKILDTFFLKFFEIFVVDLKIVAKLSNSYFLFLLL